MSYGFPRDWKPLCVIEVVREVYLLALIEENPEVLLAETQRILDDEEVDDATAYLCRVEGLMRQGKLTQTDKEIGKAQAAFRDDIRFKAQEAELMLGTFRHKQDERIPVSRRRDSAATWRRREGGTLRL
jgi:hypothetical protein